MKHLNTLFVVVLLLTSAAALRAQTLLLNQTYVNQFPSVDRLKSEEKGTDDVDSYARFVAALDVLNDMMVRDLVKAPNGSMYSMPPAADRVHEWYRVAISKNIIDSPEPPSKDPRYRPLRDKYESDPAFADSLLQRYFTPQFRTDYYAWTRKPMPATTAVKANAPAAVVSKDPSIPKAKAANVDLGLFANTIRIGEPLRLPRCPYRNNFLGLPELGEITQDCEDVTPTMTGPAADAVKDATSILIGMFGDNSSNSKKAPGPDPNIHFIVLVEDHSLSWMNSNRAIVHLAADGTIDRVVILTKGREVQKRVTDDLISKYGMEHFSEEGTVTPKQGNTVKLTNSDWFLPGLTVEYKALAIDENGNVQLEGQGYVRIETETAYKERVAAEKKDAAKKKVL